jgi:hypothetical protein
MALTDHDWDRIFEAIRAAIPPTEIVYGEVVKVDPNRYLVWVEEFGDQPIPMVGWKYTVKYYDDTTDGDTTPLAGDPLPSHTKIKKIREIKPDMPEIGDLVVVARQFGSRRLPKCVGMVLSLGGYAAV